MAKRRAGAGSGGRRATAPPPSRWLFGPASDLLLGCGGLYLLAFAAFAAAGPALRAAQPQFVFPLLVLLFSTPHYGATLLRVYERRQDRRSYVLFSVWATAGVAALFVAGLYSPWLGSLLFTVYLTWSPWHFSGQNYGIALMFLRRRGIDVDAALKRLIYASFGLSYALVFLVLHGATGGGSSAAGYAGAGVRFLPIGIPQSVLGLLVPPVAAAYAAVLTVSAVTLWRRAAAPRDLLPFGLLAVVQALWFAFPYLFRQLGLAFVDPFDARFHAFYIVWISIGHAAQYLWVTSYYARNAGAGTWRGLGAYYGKVLLAGAGLQFLPWVLFAPGALGRLSSDAGILAPAGASFLVLASAVNVHHFILDGAIWKLRNHRIASVLIRSAAPDRKAPGAVPEASWGRRLVWGASAVGLAIAALATLGRSTAPVLIERGQYERAARLLDGLAWIGQDSASNRIALGNVRARQGRPEAAMRQFERAIAVEPQADAYAGVGLLRETERDWLGASRAYEAGLRVAPRSRKLASALERVEAVERLQAGR